MRPNRLALLLSIISGGVASSSDNGRFSERQRSLQDGLPPCDYLITEESDFPEILGTPLLPELESGDVLVVNGRFMGGSDELAVRIDTVDITLASALSTLRLELFIRNSLSSGAFHDLLLMEGPLDQVYIIASTYCGGSSGQATCVLTVSDVAAGTYSIRLASEVDEEPYQLQICADGCVTVRPPDYDDLSSCAGSSDDTEGTHKYKIFKDSFTATVIESTRLQIEGKYDVALPVSSATGSFIYLQSVHVVDGNRCSSSTYSNADLQPITGTDNLLLAAFQIDAVSIPSSVYNKVNCTTGQITLCHRIELYRAGIRAILMNRVETIVTAQINLQKNFFSTNIVTEESQTLAAGTAVDSIATPEVSILNPITEVEIVSPISSGQSLKVRVDTKNSVRLEQLSDASVSTNAGKTIVIVENGGPVTAEAVVGSIDCETKESACDFTMTLPFEGFFDQAYVVQISGTAILSVGASADRRLEDLNATVGFDKAFLTMPGQASAAKRIRIVAWGYASHFPLLMVAATLLLGFE